MRHANRSSRKGVSIPEMLIGLVVVAIIGLGITKLITSQARFFAAQAASRDARNVSRSSLNRIISDLRMVETTGGVVSASATDLTVRVPFALAVSCDASVLSLLPTDSAQYEAGISGYAWRSDVGQGAMNYVESGVSVANSASTACTTAGVSVLTSDGGKVIAISPSLPVTDAGTPVLLYRQVRYQFKASSAISGATGLFRQPVSPTGTEEEISSPFASDAKFRFFVGNSSVAQDNAPSDLTTIRGIELNLTGTTERAVAGDAASKKEAVVTAIFFKNRTT